jgi:dTDP-glucose 4,6-dehydratase
LKNDPITVQGDGSQTRSLCYVDDEIRGFLALMEADYHLPVNIGNPDEISVLDIAREIKSIIGSKSEIKHTPLPPDDPKQRCPDITLAKKLLGWEPKIDRREGLRKTVEFYRQKLGV